MISMLSEVADMLQIHTAHHSDEAFGLLDRRPDLVLLDINMPGKNGMDLLKRIKSTVKSCEVVMVSNYAGEYYRETCKKLGALQFLDKTNDFELVPSLVKNFAIKNNRSTLEPEIVRS